MAAKSDTVDQAQVLNFKWSSGEQIKYNNWDKGEPGESMRCVFPFQYNGKQWDDCVSDPDDKWVKVIGSPWCSATKVFATDHRFVPCGNKAFYQECAIMNKETGKWYSDWGEYWKPTDNSGARGCYDKQNYICDAMKDGFARPIYPARPPIEGPDCLNTQDGWIGWWESDDEKSNDCYLIQSFRNTPQNGNDRGESWRNIRLNNLRS